MRIDRGMNLVRGARMRTSHGLSFVSLGLVILACSSGGPGLLTNQGSNSPDGGPADAGKKTDGGGIRPTTACDEGSRFFNGECREECRADAPCNDSAQHCIEVEEGEPALCLPYTECTYLGDDTQCVATGGYYAYSRGGMGKFVPYESTPYADPSKTTGNVDPYFYGEGDESHCAGNAKWVTTSVQTPIGCNQTYMVNRCRLVWDHCEIVRGTTREFVKP